MITFQRKTFEQTNSGPWAVMISCVEKRRFLEHTKCNQLSFSFTCASWSEEAEEELRLFIGGRPGGYMITPYARFFIARTWVFLILLLEHGLECINVAIDVLIEGSSYL
jgi:hypothetical protein